MATQAAHQMTGQAAVSQTSSDSTNGSMTNTTGSQAVNPQTGRAISATTLGSPSSSELLAKSANGINSGGSLVNRGSTSTSPVNPSDWSVEKSKELYGIGTWGSGFFDVNEIGNVVVSPHGAHGPKVDLLELTQDLQERGIRIPMLIRFPDITKARIDLVSRCFAKAIEENNYRGTYRGVYPIKVNQQRHLVEELVKFGQTTRLGLEAGSKPELLVVLAMMTTPDALIICNGFKDTEYIETAILAQKLGRNTIIVVDRMSELPMIIEAAKKFNAVPKIGLRAKLHTKGAGKWIDSSGDRSKFGLTPLEIVECVELLKRENMLSSLELLHFHIGSQIPSISCVKGSLKEGTRFYTELHQLGARPKIIDVGGGLGVDYDGSGATDSSINYTEQEYANDVISIIQSTCDEKNVPHPDIVTEAGRALVAHHSVLLFNVLGINEVQKKEPSCTVSKDDHRVVQDLVYIMEQLNTSNLYEFYHDVVHIKDTILQLFTYGVLSLEQRAKAENLCWVILTRMMNLAKQLPDADDISKPLQELLSDTYFCNFSVFQSMPDSWAVGQLFPVIPVHRLTEEPNRKANMVDLTCDSDGKIGQFINMNGESSGGKGKKTALEVHELRANEPYYMGVFLVGAYQEILGDLHNLFGDTDAVHVTVTNAGYSVDHVVEGDTVTEVLSYVQYHRPELIESIRKAAEESILSGTITKHESRLLLRHYEEGLSGYTYLED
jgi:arginine decarboxylase